MNLLASFCLKALAEMPRIFMASTLMIPLLGAMFKEPAMDIFSVSSLFLSPRNFRSWPEFQRETHLWQ
jgi:hypothetical protein